MRSYFLYVVGLAVAFADSPIDAALHVDSQQDGVSLLQVNALKHSQEEGDSQDPSELCTTGLRSGRFCCGRSCGRCGGRGCGNRPGGGRSCCTTQITQSGRRCNGRNMQNCLLPRQSTGTGMGKMGMGMGMGMGRPEPPIPPTNLASPEIVEELGLCEMSLRFDQATHSNLGGAGPDGGDADITFSNVAENTNLVITATSPYTPNMLNPTGGILRNGAHGGFGVINMASGSTVDITFSFVDSRTGSPKVMDHFVITFFDADHGMGHESRESVTIHGLTSFVVDPDTSLDIDDSGADQVDLGNGLGVAKFTSTLRGSKEDNPVSPLSLSTLQGRRSVVALFEGKSAFSVTLGETGYVNPQGRNIFFAGASSLICDREAKCASYECPLGFELRQAAEFISCEARPCTPVDHDRCCSPSTPVSTQAIAPAWR